MSPAHLSPVVLKHHEAGLRVSSAGAGGGGTSARPAPRPPWVQPAQPAHTGSEMQVTRTQKTKGVQVKKVYRSNRGQKEIRKKEKGKDDVRRRRRREGGERRGSVSKQREGGEGGRLQTRCHCQSVFI